jgi:transposase InsO family protein
MGRALPDRGGSWSAGSLFNPYADSAQDQLGAGRVVCQLSALRFSGPEMAELLSMALSTVSAVLKREGMGRLGRLGLEPAVRYEHDSSGSLIHIDVKKPARIRPHGAGHRVLGRERQLQNPCKADAAGIHRRMQVGYAYVHIAIDDYSHLAYAEVLNDEKALTAAGFLKRAPAFYQRHGIIVQRLLTDSGSPYISAVHAVVACKALGIKHIRIRPRRRQTNGKAERFIRTMLAGWAYGAIYRTSIDRTKPSTDGSTTTTINGDTQPSTPNHQGDQPSWVLQLADWRRRR